MPCGADGGWLFSPASSRSLGYNPQVANAIPRSAAKFNHILSTMAAPRCDKTLYVFGTQFGATGVAALSLERRLYTRYRPKKIVRVRKCRHCGRRVITHEAIGAWRIPGVGDSLDQQRGLAGVFESSDSGN